VGWHVLGRGLHWTPGGLSWPVSDLSGPWRRDAFAQISGPWRKDAFAQIFHSRLCPVLVPRSRVLCACAAASLSVTATIVQRRYTRVCIGCSASTAEGRTWVNVGWAGVYMARLKLSAPSRACHRSLFPTRVFSASFYYCVGSISAVWGEVYWNVGAIGMLWSINENRF